MWPADVPAARVAVAEERLDASPALVVYEIATGRIQEVARIRIDAVRHLAWPDPARPVVVARGEGAISAAEVGLVEDGRYVNLAVPGRGDVVGLIVGTGGNVWVDRCERWGDVPEEEGCLRERYFELPPGKGKASKPPAKAAVGTAAPAPAGVKLTTREGPGDVKVLECNEGSGPRPVLGPGDQVVSSPTWRWLSSDPPIALVEVEYAGGEGSVTLPSLLRGCALDRDVTVQLGPDGLWAERQDESWTIYWRGAPLSRVASQGGLVFARGAPWDGD